MSAMRPFEHQRGLTIRAARASLPRRPHPACAAPPWPGGFGWRRRQPTLLMQARDQHDLKHHVKRWRAAITQPSRVWVWQEQVLPILLALSSVLAARSSIISGERELSSEQVSTHGGKGWRAPARQAPGFGSTSAAVTARAGAARCRPQLRQRRKHQAPRPKRDGQSGRAPPYRRGSRSPSPRGRRRTDARALRADAG
jgi:hypothetical protein